ncbi:EAL domain-containing protein [Oscillatoria sp. FACHB-1407]|uniref:EAL domain-containing response regulator n=1 Tax=Oscillatoria sp. FACHB-1407 TaxID=2692847 RepID=UPI0016899ACD|nr:EAL domain-containing protein [Oscillatoria sp. FACHB-1407]MBD2465672.1 EAL domain-containing protein [Oscillatoria sp. FACHB-1407]
MTRILVIEDEAPIRENIVDILLIEGFEVAEAVCGATGLQLAMKLQPDLILCDVMMPNLDGYELLKILRKSPETATIPFIFLTAKTTKADFRQGMVTGADDYLTKPFTASELLEAITSQLTKQTAIAEKYDLERQQLEEKFNHSLHFDRVTGLPNQLLLHEQFNQLREQSETHQPIGVLCILLQQFNRLISLPEADLHAFLQQFVDRLRQCVQQQTGVEHQTAAEVITRLNLNKFTVFLTNHATEAEIIQTTEILLRELTQPFDVTGQRLYLSLCIGISRYPLHDTQVENLVRNAELAAESIPAHMLNAYQFYTPALRQRSQEQLMLENELRASWESNHFCVYYQPQINAQTGKVIGAEALIRCLHPTRGLIPPFKFIPLAEETGLIVPIGEWVARCACQQAKEWQTEGQPSVRIAVNLSPRQLNQPQLEQMILSVLQETGLPPECLELEITESCVMEDLERAIATLRSLQNRGIRIALDDFGTGYSSLGYLKRLPLNTLKIDRSFVSHVQDDPQNREIVKNIIQMAHTLGLKTVAEGVETQAEVDYLRQQGCDELQGYFFSRPVPTSDLEIFLQTWRGLSSG